MSPTGLYHRAVCRLLDLVFEYFLIVMRARVARMDERGASAVEYGLLIAGVAAAMIFVVMVLGATLSAVFEETNSNLSGPAN